MPKTLEEALELINQLNTQVTDLKTKNQTILDEKKKVLEMFNDKDKEGMTETEKKLAEALEVSNAELKKVQDQINADNAKRESDAKERVSKALEERIVKISKGDTAVAEKLRANVALLDKMPTATDAEIDAIATSAFNMLGTKDVNPLTQINNGNGGDVKIDNAPSFADTEVGKKVASKLGLDIPEKKAEAAQ